MEVQKIVVVVEDVEAARTALEWALRNLLRCGDVLTLLHVFTAPEPPRSRSKKKMRLLRLKGFQLALSFKEICSSFNTNIEIIVTEGDEEGRRILAVVREIGAHALVLGLHQHSFLYRLAMGLEESSRGNFYFNCRIVAVKQPEAGAAEWGATASTRFQLHGSTNLDFSQIELTGLQIPDIPPPKIPYRICPSPHAIIWRSRKSKKKKRSSST